MVFAAVCFADWLHLVLRSGEKVCAKYGFLGRKHPPRDNYIGGKRYFFAKKFAFLEKNPSGACELCYMNFSMQWLIEQQQAATKHQ